MYHQNAKRGKTCKEFRDTIGLLCSKDKIEIGLRLKKAGMGQMEKALLRCT